jgi:hypothetical protein
MRDAATAASAGEGGAVTPACRRRDAVSPRYLELDPRPEARGTYAIDRAALGAIARV